MNDVRILIVDSELLFAIDLESNLENFGYKVADKVTNGDEAIKKASELRPDLIMMDSNLDGHLNSIETSQIIKKTLDIPVIFLTAHSDIQTIDHAKLTEPYGFLLKPLRVDEVNSMIKGALNKHQIEIKLKESKKRFRGLTGLLPQPVFELDLEYNVKFANRSFLEYFSFDQDDMEAGINFNSIFTKNDMLKIKQKLQKVIDGVSLENYEIKTIDRFDKLKYSLLYANQIENHGKVIGIRGTITDISKRKETEHRLMTQKLFFEALFENSPEAIASTNRDGQIIRINSHFEKLFGYSGESVIGKNIDKLLTSDEYYGEAVEFTLKLRNSHERNSIETKRLTKDGKQIDTIVVASPVTIDDELSFIIVIYIDIRKRKRLEFRMQRIHELYQKIIQNAQGVPYRLNLIDKKYEFVGNGVEDILDMSLEDFSFDYLNKIKKEVILPDNCSYRAYKEKFQNGGLDRYQVDFQIFTENQEEKWISDNALPVFDCNEDKVVEAIGILQDITKRKLVEKQLRLEKDKVQNYLNVAGVIFMSLDVDLNVIMINKKGCDILGVEEHEIIHKNWVEEFIPEKHKEKTYEFYNEFKTEQLDMFHNHYKRSANLESKINTRKSEPKIILWNNILLRDENKVNTSILCSGIDITDKVNAELGIKNLNTKLKRKNYDLERIIYITSHDLRSPLVNIEGFGDELHKDVKYILDEVQKADSLENLKSKIETVVEADIPESLQYIKNSVLKIESLLSALLRLSRLGRQELAVQELDMNELFQVILNTFEYQINQKYVNMKIGNLPNCVADRKQINQLFSNLIGNALKFLSHDRVGEIEIRGRRTEKWSYYYIRDNGMGIKKENQEKIFEIFKRIHNQNIEGDGLGLSIVRRILEKNHGDIKVESEFGEWTKFTVMLPNEQVV